MNVVMIFELIEFTCEITVAAIIGFTVLVLTSLIIEKFIDRGVR